MTTALNHSLNLLATIGDPDGTRTVTSIVALLVALGLGLAMVAVWLRRTTRPDPETLAPLEMMGERRWRRADPVAQRRTLDDARPDGAAPLEPAAAPPTFDEAFDSGSSVTGFDDLHGDSADDAGGDQALDLADLLAADINAAAPEETPRQIDRPDGEGFAGDIDPDVLAAAAAELDAEFGAETGEHPSDDT